MINGKFDRKRHITPNFRWNEFIRDVDAIPPAPILRNLVKLAQALEGLRTVFGNRPISITSAYRTPEHNREVGGEAYSYHLRGMAADIIIVGAKPSDIWKTLKDTWPGGLGTYPTFTHVDIRPYRARWIKK
jgi:uncharacterized protein YcbK (DUF882 family)